LITALLVLTLLPSTVVRAAVPQASVPSAAIERVEFVGNRRVQNDTLRARIFTRPGDPSFAASLTKPFPATIDGVRTKVRDSNRFHLGSASLGSANPCKVSSVRSANEKKLNESSLRR
jgi:hypothetical protein